MGFIYCNICFGLILVIHLFLLAESMRKLKDLLQQPENCKCADCNARNPKWAWVPFFSVYFIIVNDSLLASYEYIFFNIKISYSLLVLQSFASSFIGKHIMD